MGQKSNLITLQKNKKSLNLLTQNPKLFLKGFTFINHFERMLNKKNLIVDNKELNFESNKLFLNFSVFFSSTKTLFYRKKGMSVKKNSFLETEALKKLLFKQFSSLNNNVVSLSLINLNNHLDKNSLSLFYKNFKRFIGVLFSRRFNLFIDFLKINSLFLHSKILPRCF